MKTYTIKLPYGSTVRDTATCFDHYTTVKATNDTEAKLIAKENIAKAMTFGHPREPGLIFANKTNWTKTRDSIDKCDLVIEKVVED